LIEEAIKTVNLTKTFGEFVAVDTLNLAIDKGEIFGLLGPNGAGKSTTIKMLIGLLKPTYGEIFVFGENDVNKYKQYTGYLPETPNLYEYLTVEEFLTFIGTLKKVKKDLLDERIKEYSEIFDLKDKLKSYIGSLSHGMKQKVAIMAALINDPKVLLLDEPLNGLDPMSQKDFKDILREKANDGCAILLSTHILDVAERICTTVGVFNKGSLITTGTLDELRDMYRSPPTSTLEDIFLKITKKAEP